MNALSKTNHQAELESLEDIETAINQYIRKTDPKLDGNYYLCGVDLKKFERVLRYTEERKAEVMEKIKLEEFLESCE
jgi:hypothetical protein